MDIRKGVSVSWNVSLMDTDNHEVHYNPTGKSVALPFRQLLIRENAGLQMHVVVPRGVKIGVNSVISAGTTLRIIA